MHQPEPKHPEIIYRPDLQPRGQRALFSAITLGAWFVWFYLLLPLMSLAAWWFGFEVFRDFMLDDEGGGYLATLTGYAAVIASTALLVIGWSRYNQARYGGRERRRPTPPVTIEMTRERFALDARTLDQARNAKRMEIELDEAGRLLSAEFETDSRPGSGKEAEGMDRH